MPAKESQAQEKSKVTIRTRKFSTNRLLKRRQLSVDILHPGKQSLSKAALKTKIAAMYKIGNADSIILYGFKTKFGGGKSTGFALIYDSVQDAKKTELRFRLVRHGLMDKIKDKKTRKQVKEKKNRAKKVRSKEKVKIILGIASAKKD